jgi:hypothetical protein
MDTITINATQPLNRAERRLIDKIKARGTIISQTPTGEENAVSTEVIEPVKINDHRNGSAVAESTTITEPVAESAPITEPVAESTPVADSTASAPADSVTLTPEQLAEAKRLLDAHESVGKAALHAIGAGAKAVTKTPGLTLKGVGFLGGLVVRGAKAVGHSVADGYRKAGA